MSDSGGRWCGDLSRQRRQTLPIRSPRTKMWIWKRVRLRLGARDYEDDSLTQIDVHIPLVVSVMIVVEADDRVWQMAGLVVAVVGGVGFWVQNDIVVEAIEGRKVVGCEGAWRLPRRSRHNRYAEKCGLRFRGGV